MGCSASGRSCTCCARTSRTSASRRSATWVSEDLVEPQRTPLGTGSWTRADAERLRYVLRMQRDHYLPLKVSVSTSMRRPAPLSATVAPRGTWRPLMLSRQRTSRPKPGCAVAQGFCSRSPGHHQSANSKPFGLNLRQAPGTSFYDAAALQVARICAEMAHFGYGPRHLRPFRLAADRGLRPRGTGGQAHGARPAPGQRRQGRGGGAAPWPSSSMSPWSRPDCPRTLGR